MTACNNLVYASFGRHCQKEVAKKYWPSRPRNEHNTLTPLGRDLHAISNLLWHATNASWFEYKAGSWLYHFRFPLIYQKIVQDGVPIFFEKECPTKKQCPLPFASEQECLAVKEKITKVIYRQYVAKTGVKIKSLIKDFAVPKGYDDVRMAYDANANELNDRVWVPLFWLPTVDSMVRALDAESWMADGNVGEMFLNFQLHKSVQPYTGVNLSLDEDNDDDKHTSH